MKGDFVTMENPKTTSTKEKMIRPYKDKSNKELLDILATKGISTATALYALIESNERKDKQIANLIHRVSVLEEKAAKKVGRKRQSFSLNGQELTDDDIIYYVDNDYMSISELEKDVGAKKNQLRNRYNRRKKQLAIEKNILKNNI